MVARYTHVVPTVAATRASERWYRTATDIGSVLQLHKIHILVRHAIMWLMKMVPLCRIPQT